MFHCSSRHIVTPTKLAVKPCQSLPDLAGFGCLKIIPLIPSIAQQKKNRIIQKNKLLQNRKIYVRKTGSVSNGLRILYLLKKGVLYRIRFYLDIFNII